MQARACFWHTVIGMGCEFPSLARRTLHLENGVQVALLHDPQATRIALAGSLAAGSFHEPAGWPGLAHFVEHALFLGSHGRPGASDFADYVHAHGGRYNARTLALQTLYLLEMPAREWPAALAALDDLLFRPLFCRERLLRERAVLHAEYLARCADGAQQVQGAIAEQLHPGHPLSRFHAGAQDTLQPQSAQFMTDLRDWHARHYRAANLCLLISSPQSLDALERQVRERLSALPAAPPEPAPDWPDCWPAGQPALELLLQQPEAIRRMSLWWPLALEPALQEPLQTLLDRALQRAGAGSLAGELRARGWAQRLAVQVQPADAGSGLLVLHVDLLDAGATHEREIAALCCDWLESCAADPRLLADEPVWQAICREQAWQEYELPAFERTALWVERWRQQGGGDWRPWPPVTLETLAARLARLERRRMIVQYARPHLPCAATTPWFPVRWQARPLAGWPAVRSPRWQAPPPNPFLPSGPRPATALPDGASMQRPGHAAVLLCWRGEDAQGVALAGAPLAEAALAQHWREALADARQAGCDWCSLAHPGQLRFHLSGPAQLLAPVLSTLLAALHCRDGGAWRAALRRQETEGAQQMLLRQMLTHPAAQCRPGDEALPAAALAQIDDEALPALLRRFLRDSALHRLDFGAVPEAVGQVLQGWGRPVPAPPSAPAHPEPGVHSRRLGLGGDEQAVLLRLLAPRIAPREEAAWRLLAVLRQGAFYQALRVEQGLGYALFSRFQTGEAGIELQFGVQSPRASAEQLQEAIRRFVADGAAALATLPEARLQQARQAVLDSLAEADGQRARRLRACQAWLNAEPAGWTAAVRAALAELSQAELCRAATALGGPDTSWYWLLGR